MNELQHRGDVPQISQVDFILLDGSTSMQPIWSDSLRAIESYVDTMKAQNVNTEITLATFSTRDIQCVQRKSPIATWESLVTKPIGSHWGGTPLYDAIVMMGVTMRDLDPSKASILIVTDGANTSSVNTIEQARGILDWMRAKGWQVTFIGAEFNNSTQAKMLGAHESECIGVSQARLIDATKALGEKRARYGLYGEAMGYTEDEKQQFGGYLNAPESPKGVNSTPRSWDGSSDE